MRCQCAALAWLSIAVVPGAAHGAGQLASGSAGARLSAGTFYVDPNRGDDANPGAIRAPFRSLRQALAVVGDRVNKGILSDKIYLRGGVYKVEEALQEGSLYRLNLKGTPGDYAVLSAMPAAPGTPGAVQRKSGKWYERVVFDDAHRILGPWKRHPRNANIWMTNPGYKKMKWWPTYQNTFGYKDRHFPVSQFVCLQDGRALYWSDRLEEHSEPFCVPKFTLRRYPGWKNPMAPGRHTYDVETDTLYIWPYDEKDPNDAVIETWNKVSRWRHLFGGNWEYAAIRGMEFRLVKELFRGAQYSAHWVRRHVLWEDTDFLYSFRALISDVRGAHFEEMYPGKGYPSYANMGHWHIRHNRFYRVCGEVVQIFGVGNIFEYNEIIRRGHPCAGPISWVSCCNWRNCLGVVIRGNYVYGNALADERGKPGGANYTFLIETYPPYKLRAMPVLEGHRQPPARGEHCFEYNVFVDCDATGRSALMELGKMTGRLEHITIRHNIFINTKTRQTIGISTPHKNLRIHNNVFYGTPYAIANTAWRKEKRTIFGDLPSTVSIRDNIFVNCKETIHKMLVKPKSSDKVVIDRNLFFNSKAVGDRAIAGKDPMFMNPEKLDFRVRPGSPAIVPGHDIGVYDAGAPLPQGTEWWRLAERRPNETPINRLPE